MTAIGSLRKNLGRDDLYVFDGNPDSITRLEILYHRITKSKPKEHSEKNQYDHVVRDYSEHLVIDSHIESIEYIRQIGSSCVSYCLFCFWQFFLSSGTLK